MRMIAIAAALTAGMAVGAASAADPDGVWKTEEKEDGRYLHVEVAPCPEGPVLCGTVVGAYGGARQESVGRRIFWDMAPAGPGRWDGGEVWAADEDKIYSGKIALEGEVFEISGCVLGGLICRGQGWTRVD